MMRRSIISDAARWRGARLAWLGLGLFAAGCSGNGALSGIAETLTLAPREEFVQLREQQQLAAETAAVYCPPVEIRQGTETLRVYDAERQGDPMAVRYQGTLQRTARECSLVGDQFTMKFGVTGRLILGPAGQPETYTLPLRAALVGDGEAVWTKLIPVPVTVGSAGPSVEFVHVDADVAYQLPPGTDLTKFVLFVGFDEQDRLAQR